MIQITPEMRILVAVCKSGASMPVKRPSRKAESGDAFGQRRSKTKMFRARLYTRVSTSDQQTLPTQNRALRE